MSALPEILAHNAEFVANKSYEEFLTSALPNKRLVIITCMDTRLVELLPKAMGMRNGDAKFAAVYRKLCTRHLKGDVDEDFTGQIVLSEK